MKRLWCAVKTLILHLSLAHSGPPAEQAADDVGQEVTDTLVLLTSMPCFRLPVSGQSLI